MKFEVTEKLDEFEIVIDELNKYEFEAQLIIEHELIDYDDTHFMLEMNEDCNRKYAIELINDHLKDIDPRMSVYEGQIPEFSIRDGHFYIFFAGEVSDNYYVKEFGRWFELRRM